MFVGLFTKKKDELSVGNLRKLVKAFDTLEDPVLQMKLSSVKRGVEGTIALTQSHGEEVVGEGGLLLCSTPSGDEGVL
jgi:hypothetical protein